MVFSHSKQTTAVLLHLYNKCPVFKLVSKIPLVSSISGQNIEVVPKAPISDNFY